MSDEQLKQIKNTTLNDESMIKVAQYIRNRWPTHIKQIHSVARQFWHFREDLAITDEITFKGKRIVIPPSVQKDILLKLHQAHLSIEKTKLRARETVFWPGIYQDIERVVKLCTKCQELRNSNAKQPMISSEVSDYPFQITETNLFYWNRQDNLIVVDYYSRYWEIARLRNTTSTVVIQKLKKTFSRFGIPEVPRSDNGPQFRSRKFAEFSKNWNFIQNTSSPSHPQGNSLAERSIQTAKIVANKIIKI